jgi:hypothetical protein
MSLDVNTLIINLGFLVLSVHCLIRVSLIAKCHLTLALNMLRTWFSMQASLTQIFLKWCTLGIPLVDGGQILSLVTWWRLLEYLRGSWGGQLLILNAIPSRRSLDLVLELNIGLLKSSLLVNLGLLLLHGDLLGLFFDNPIVLFDLWRRSWTIANDLLLDESIYKYCILFLCHFV